MTRPAMLALVAACALFACSGERIVPVVALTPAVALPATGATYIAGAPNLSTLAAAAKVSGVAEMLGRTGPFTIFAPTDAAFARLAPGMLDALLRPENRGTLIRLLSCHVVAGTLTIADLRARATAGAGTATLVSIEGDALTLSVTAGHITLTDGDGNRSYVETGDVIRSNGIVHVVNGVLVPRLG